MKTWIMIMMALAFRAAPAFAQTPAGLEPGEPIRVMYRIDAAPESETIEVTGAYRSLTPERLRLTVGHSGEREHEVAMDRLIRLDAREGSGAARGAGKGAIYGGVAGAVFGLIVVAAECSGGGGYCGGEMYALAAGLMGGTGAGVGALTGALIGRERWQEVQLDRETGGAP